GAGSSNTTVGFNSFFGSNAGSANTVGIRNSFFGGNFINGVPIPDTNVGIGTTAPTNRLDVNVGNSSLTDPGITIRGQTSSGNLGLRIQNTNAGNEWYIDSTGGGSSYGAGNLAFAIRGT